MTPLASPADTAAALRRLLTDPEAYRRSSEAARTRVRRYYDKTHLYAAYRQLYDAHLAAAAEPVEA